MVKKWVPYEKDYRNLDLMMKELNISELYARVLINRGLDTPETAAAFLNPAMDNLHDPYLMKGMDGAVKRINEAIQNQERICIYGDYDVDGITATAISVKVLTAMNADVIYYIPARLEEGYGLNAGAVDKVKELGAKLLVSVDCGIRSVEVVEHAKSIGLEVIITDHHECGEILPDACSVLNPHQPGCLYPCKDISGVGVAFKLLTALYPDMPAELLDEIVEITSIGTIADVVPLLDENRIMVKKALGTLANTHNRGLRALIDVSRAGDRSMTAYSVAFIIAPRLNAAGRLADANVCVELFLTLDEARALDIATLLDKTNRERQAIEGQILQEAIAKIEADYEMEKEKVLVLDNEAWHVGVIGIVASRLVERYAVPVVMLASDENLGKGSARSLAGFNIYEAMSRCSSLFEKFGGHEMAAGVTLKKENIGRFREMLREVAEEICGDQKLQPEIKVDFKLTPEDVKMDTIRQISLLEPFGSGNPMPQFVYRNLEVLSSRTVGAEEKHLSLNLYDGRQELRAIAFNQGSLQKRLQSGRVIDIICCMEINTWNQTDRIQLNIKDIKITK